MKFNKKFKYRIAVICMLSVLLLSGILPSLINYSVYAVNELSEEQMNLFANSMNIDAENALENLSFTVTIKKEQFEKSGFIVPRDSNKTLATDDENRYQLTLTVGVQGSNEQETCVADNYQVTPNGDLQIEFEYWGNEKPDFSKDTMVGFTSSGVARDFEGTVKIKGKGEEPSAKLLAGETTTTTEETRTEHQETIDAQKRAEEEARKAQEEEKLRQQQAEKDKNIENFKENWITSSEAEELSKNMTFDFSDMFGDLYGAGYINGNIPSDTVNKFNIKLANDGDSSHIILNGKVCQIEIEINRETSDMNAYSTLKFEMAADGSLNLMGNMANWDGADPSKTYRIRIIDPDTGNIIYSVDVTPGSVKEDEPTKTNPDGATTEISNGETELANDYKENKDDDHAGLFEHAISAFIRAISKGFLTLIRLLSGSDTLSIESIIFNRYSYTSLSLFENENRIVNPLIDNGIKDTLNSIFKSFQSIAIVLYMIIVAYMGLRIMLNSTARQGAKYKELILYLIQGVMILFLFPYVIKYTIDINDAFVHYIDINKVSTKNVSASFKSVTNSGLDNITSASKQTESDLINGSDYMSLMYQEAKEKGRLVYAICFAVMVKQLIAFLVIYFKRLLTIIFLIAIFPLVSISYAIDKIGDGKSQAFNNWYKEFALNVFLQSFHAIIYVIGMAMIVEIGNAGNFSRNWLVIILLLEFIANGDEFLRNLFGVKGGGADTVKGIAKSVVQTKVALDVAAGAKKAVTDRFKTGGHLSKANAARIAMMEGFSQARYAKAERKQSVMEMENADARIADLGLNNEEEKAIPLNTSVDILLSGEDATEEEKKEALNSLIDAVNGAASEDELKALSDYATAQYGAEAAKQLDTLIKTQAAVNAILVGGLTNVELKENIDILLEAYAIGGMAATIASRAGSERQLKQMMLSQNTKFAKPVENVSLNGNKNKKKNGKNKLPKSRKRRKDKYEGRFTPTQEQGEGSGSSHKADEISGGMLGNGGNISTTFRKDDTSRNSNTSRGNSRFMNNPSKPASNQPDYKVPSNLANGGANAKAGKKQKLLEDQAKMFDKMGRHEEAEEVRAQYREKNGARSKNPFRNRPGARSNIKNGRISGKVTINGRPVTAAIRKERPGSARANGHMDTPRVVITAQSPENGKIKIPVKSHNAPTKNFISVDVNDSDTKIIVCKKVKKTLREVGDNKPETSAVAETLKERRKNSGFTGDVPNKLDTIKENKLKLSEEVMQMASRDAIRNVEMIGSTIINGRHIASGMPTTRPYVEVKPTEAMVELGKKYVKPELLNDNSNRGEKVVSLASSVAALNMISSGKTELTASETLDHIDNIKQIKFGLENDLAKLKAVDVNKLPDDKKEKFKAQLKKTQSYVDEVNNVVSKLGYDLDNAEANLRVKSLASSVAALNMISSGRTKLTASETLDHIENIKQITSGLEEDLAKLKAVDVNKLSNDKKEKFKAQLKKTQSYVDEVNDVVSKLDYELGDVEANLRVKVLNDTSLIAADDPNRNQIINSSIRYVQDKLSDDSVFLNELHYNRDELKVGVEPMQRYGREYKESSMPIGFKPTELDLEKMAALDEKRAIEATMEEQRQKIINSRDKYVKSIGGVATNAAKATADFLGTAGSVGLGVISAGVGSSGKDKDYMLASTESGLAGYTMAENAYSTISHGASSLLNSATKKVGKVTKDVAAVKKTKKYVQNAYADALKSGTGTSNGSTMSSKEYKRRELQKLEKRSKLKGKSFEELSKKNSNGNNN